MDIEYQKVTITLPKKIQDEYRRLLDKIGISLSKRLSILIEKDLKLLRQIEGMDSFSNRDPTSCVDAWNKFAQKEEVKKLKRSIKK